MNLEDRYRSFVGAFYGVRELDEYPLKEYVLHDLEHYIREFVEEHNFNFDLMKEAEKVEQEVSLKGKLQDCLLILPKMEASLELILLVKKKIQEISEEKR